MTDHDQRVTLGEMARSLARIEAAVAVLQTYGSAPLQALSVRLHATEEDVADLKSDMKAVRKDAAMVSGGLGVIAFIASWFHK